MDGSYQILAARYVRRQTRQLTGQLDGVRKADDVEFVHRARVVSRRLRAALEIFRDCFKRKQVKRWRKRVRQLTQGLGPARDKDVQITFLRGVLAGLEDPGHRAGISRLVLRLEQSRRALQPEVIEAVDRLEASGVTEEMLAAAKRMLSELKQREASVRSRSAARWAEDHILTCLNEFMEYEDCLANPQDVQQHHAMRIAAKGLRYTMEICQPCYEGGLEEFVQVVKNVQSLLGDIHDCDVWVEDLPRFVEEERERTIAYYGHARPFGRLKIGLDYLRQERASHRQQAFGELIGLWQELSQEGLWERMIGTVRSPLDPSTGSGPPNGTPALETDGKPKSPPCRRDDEAHPGEGNGHALPAAEQPAGRAKPGGGSGHEQRALLGAGRPGEIGS
ncbi:MAG: hypothetical protein A2V98_06315 [Planctomycetes bacterium RBG_16_64_12]|nr:MAG: hypothetical protein A2V98_06315 [Planctomycetes bacterium RBG_16_64_12]